MPIKIERPAYWWVVMSSLFFLTACDFEKELDHLMASLGLIEGDKANNDSEAKALAVLKNIKNEVKVKRHDSLSFEEGAENTSLQEDDSISTQTNSNAVLKFKDGNMVRIEGDSLVVVHKLEQDENGESVINITLESGAVQSRCSKDTQTNTRLKITAGQSTAESEEACSELGLRRNKDGTEEAWVNKGKMMVKRGKEIKKMAAGEKASFGNIRNLGNQEQEFGVSEGEKKMLDKLSPTQIDQAIQQIKKRIRDCYLSEMSSIRKEVSISGTIEVLGKDGRVGEVSLKESEGTDPALAKCTMRFARMARFPAFIQAKDTVSFSIILN